MTKNKNSKVIGIVIVSLALIIVGFWGVTKMSQNSNPGQENKVTATENSSDNNTVRKNAENLIGKTVTQDDVKSKVGNWKDFEMSNQGCERGVYAGRFYYDNFIIFSKTYDKGDTYHIESINEK